MQEMNVFHINVYVVMYTFNRYMYKCMYFAVFPTPRVK